jgi:hypothetical protein
MVDYVHSSLLLSSAHKCQVHQAALLLLLPLLSFTVVLPPAMRDSS